MSTQRAAGPVRSSFAPWLDPGAKPLVSFRNVRKSFGAVEAVAGVNLDLYPREFFALLGPSGCGKTTLMRMLAGFEEPTFGRHSSRRQERARRARASAPDEPDVPVLRLVSAYECGGEHCLWPEAGGAAQGRNRRAGGGGAEPRAPCRFRQKKARSALRRAEAARGFGPRHCQAPRVLLLDEPLGALDRKLREETQYELVALQEKLGLAFLMVTHDQDEAMTMAHRMA